MRSVPFVAAWRFRPAQFGAKRAATIAFGFGIAFLAAASLLAAAIFTPAPFAAAQEPWHGVPDAGAGPVQPPAPEQVGQGPEPAQTNQCGVNSVAVADYNPGAATATIIRDCNTLLDDVMGSLQGIGLLNWSITRKMSEWDGITTAQVCDPATPCYKVTGIALTSKSFTNGAAPAALGSLDGLKTLILDNNALEGTLPRELGNLSALQTLSLKRNQLTGIVPPELGNLSNLTTLDLSENCLIGNIPAALTTMPNLKILALNDNHRETCGEIAITGPVAELYGNPADQKVESGLYPSIPAALGNGNANGLPRLEQLRLQGNRLSGTIPTELGNLSTLKQLRLGNNMLSGGIPAELGSLSALTDLRLGDNRLSGSIPPQLRTLTSLTMLHLQNNQLTGAIPAELGQLAALTSLSLHRNQLTGNIPTALGSLSNLECLYLNHNRLDGSIPAQLGNLSNLECLYLNDNRLTGGIPSALVTGLASLQELGLAGAVTLSGLPAPIVEDAGAQTITVNAQLDTATAWAAGFVAADANAASNLQITASGSGTARAVIFTASSDAFHIARGADNANGTLVITPTDNDDDNVDETVTVSISGVGAPGVADLALSPAAAYAITLVDDNRPDVILPLNPKRISENGGASTVSAALVTASGADTVVTISLMPADAAYYTLTGAATQTITAGQLTSSATLTITAVDDQTVSGNRQIQLSATAVNTAPEGVSTDNASATLTIIEDDMPPTPEPDADYYGSDPAIAGDDEDDGDNGDESDDGDDANTGSEGDGSGNTGDGGGTGDYANTGNAGDVPAPDHTARPTPTPTPTLALTLTPLPTLRPTAAPVPVTPAPPPITRSIAAPPPAPTAPAVSPTSNPAPPTTATRRPPTTATPRPPYTPQPAPSPAARAPAAPQPTAPQPTVPPPNPPTNPPADPATVYPDANTPLTQQWWWYPLLAVAVLLSILVGWLIVLLIA